MNNIPMYKASFFNKSYMITSHDKAFITYWYVKKHWSNEATIKHSFHETLT